MACTNIARPAPIIRAVRRLDEIPAKDVEKNSDTTFTALFASPYSKIYTLGIMRKSDFNALMAAIEVYTIKAKTSKLPDSLPAIHRILTTFSFPIIPYKR